jgi:hypothetical protein
MTVYREVTPYKSGRSLLTLLFYPEDGSNKLLVTIYLLGVGLILRYYVGLLYQPRMMDDG